MKKLFLAALVAVCAFGASAQTFWDSEAPEKKVTFGVRAGLNIASVTDKPSGVKSRTSFHAGVSADWNIINSLSVNSGLFYTGKGIKDLKADFLEIPIYASYRINFAEQSQLQVNFGPYLDFGIAGDAFKDDMDGKRFQMGLGVGAGYTFHKFLLGFQYQFGMTKAFKDGKNKWTNMAITLGYNF